MLHDPRARWMKEQPAPMTSLPEQPCRSHSQQQFENVNFSGTPSLSRFSAYGCAGRGGLPRADTRRLLIVDDISDNRSILMRRFRASRRRRCRSRLTVAIELIENSCFDLVLLDVMMPGIDG